MTGYNYQHIVNRLNETLGTGHFRQHFENVDVDVHQTSTNKPMYYATLAYTLTLGNWIDGQWETIAEAKSFGGHDALVRADALKGAHTSAFKIAVAFFGVGRQAYEVSIDPEGERAPPADIPAFPDGEFTVRIKSGTYTSKVSAKGKPYNVFEGKAVLETGELFPLKAFDDLGEALQSGLEKNVPLAIRGNWSVRFGNFDVKDVHLAVKAPASAKATPVSPKPPVTQDAPAAQDSPPKASAPQDPPVATVSPRPSAEPASAETGASPTDPAAAAPDPSLQTFDDLKPFIKDLRAAGVSDKAINEALQRALPLVRYSAYTSEHVARGQNVLADLLASIKTSA